MLIILLLLQLADIYTTHHILKRGGVELNPILAKLFTKANPLVVMAVFKSVFIALVWWIDLFIATLLCCMVYVLVVANNVRVLKNMK